jgi:hypothetical protein
MRSPYLLVMLCAATMAVPASGADSVFAHYRGVTLGDSLEAVVERLKTSPTDIRALQEHPTPVRELTWRPAYQFGPGLRAAPEAMTEMVLTFHRNRLTRIVVAYDRERTRGMTDDDLRDALVHAYGAAMLVSRQTAATALATAMAPAAPETIGRWGDAATRVVLWREPFPDRVKLTITAIDSDQAMQTALAEGLRFEGIEAQTRDVVRRVVEAAGVQAREQSARRDNKAAFKP